mmetsp:Transcript_13922/g.48500  ORF Transcript_13922/g.48500 Transcript_13922/m.48500 type:complete len:248 (-) Transcript_13922:1545-2288(-)
MRLRAGMHSATTRYAGAALCSTQAAAATATGGEPTRASVAPPQTPTAPTVSAPTAPWSPSRRTSSCSSSQRDPACSTPRTCSCSSATSRQSRTTSACPTSAISGLPASSTPSAMAATAGTLGAIIASAAMVIAAATVAAAAASACPSCPSHLSVAGPRALPRTPITSAWASAVPSSTAAHGTPASAPSTLGQSVEATTPYRTKQTPPRVAANRWRTRSAWRRRHALWRPLSRHTRRGATVPLFSTAA